MPPGLPIAGLVCRRATWTPCTITRFSVGKTRRTSPRRPLSRPLITTTVSPFLIFIFGMAGPLQDLGGERDDPHEAARAEFAGHRTDDTGPDRLALVADQHRGVAVEADRAAIGAADLLRCADNDGAVHIALLDAAARDRLLD